MTILNTNNIIYDNAIEEYFHEYFENRNIDLSGDGYKKVETNLYNGAFRYIYKKIFKPSLNDKRKYNINSKIDYDDYTLLEDIVNIYCDLCTSYNIPGKIDFFCDMTGIHRSTLFRWENDNTRGYIYYDMDGNIIRDIQEYKLNNRGEYRQEPSTAHCNLTKKLKQLNKQTANNMLYDFQNGQMMIANNEPDAGMEYNHKRQIEAATTQIATIEDIKSRLSELNQNKTQFIESEQPKTQE